MSWQSDYLRQVSFNLNIICIFIIRMHHMEQNVLSYLMLMNVYTGILLKLLENSLCFYLSPTIFMKISTTTTAGTASRNSVGYIITAYLKRRIPPRLTQRYYISKVTSNSKIRVMCQGKYFELQGAASIYPSWGKVLLNIGSKIYVLVL